MRYERRVREPIVAIMHNEQIHDAVNGALSLLPVDRLLQPSDTVLVKFNAVSVQSGEKKDSPVIKAETLSSVIKWFQAQNLKRLVFAEGSKGGTTADIMEQTGLMKVIRETGVEFIDLNTGPYMQIPLPYDKPPVISVNKIVGEADVLVSLAALKMHEEATVTLTQKNIALSIPSGEVHGFPLAAGGGDVPRPGRSDPHADLHTYIVRVMQKVPIDIAIIDGKTTMIGTGPIKGKPVVAAE
ncbi:MAG TPA: DUF362 domain-containing protein [Armatimonadota bacterium]|nr:DUF362 domain-containing protein [Armatimonadota bacterium]